SWTTGSPLREPVHAAALESPVSGTTPPLLGYRRLVRGPRPPRSPVAESSALGDRPLQPAVCLLHARAGLRLAATRRRPAVRRDGGARRCLPRPGRGQDSVDRR